MVDGKDDESGFALISVLGAIILIAVMIGGIFFIARIVFFQVEKVDQFNRIKEVEEYALEDGTDQIQKKIDDYLSELEMIDFGEDITTIGSAMDRLFSGFSISAEDIGSQKQFSYALSIKEIKKEKVTPYVLASTNGSYGWVKDTSIMNPTKATNVKLTFEVEAEVKEKQKNGTEETAIGKSSYSYEVQWNDIDVADELTELDVWRNVVYSHYLPNGARYLSADAWMRKMDAIYRYNSKPLTFDFNGFNNLAPHKTGYSNGQLVDITDGTLLDFSLNGKGIQSTLNFEGSLLLENGIQLEGGNASSRLVTNNLLGLRNHGNKKNYIQNLNIVASNGSYIDLNGQESYLAINEKDASFKTSSLLVNHTQRKKDHSTGGLLFGSGELLIQTQSTARAFSFGNYPSNALKKSPQDEYWNDFLKGSLVIASSNFYAGPLSVNSNIQSSETDVRQITVDGNFMLTNAMLDSETGAEGLSYFQKEGSQSTPNAPSTLTLDGKNTKMQVVGKTFLDAPKANRRKSPTEEDATKNGKFYGDQSDWNSIYLKNGAVMELGYTGFEPFNLTIEKDAIFSAKVLPNLDFFDTMFLSNSVGAGKLKGKVILQTFNQNDANELKAELQKRKIPVSIAANESYAKNGEVTIIKPDNPAGVDSSQIISRTFYYVNKVDY